jgi:hypothetical protein
MLCVLLTCVRRCLNQCKRNQLNWTTVLGENTQNVPKYWDILEFAQISKIRPHFRCFLRLRHLSLDYPQHSIS